MTEAAAPTERVRPAQALPITPARAAVLQEACAAATAIHSALDLGAVVRGPYPFTLITGRRR
jgi:hypothetical protein